MFIKLKQKIHPAFACKGWVKKYQTKILSKKISGFGIFKFPYRKVLLGVFLMMMIFGGIFGEINNASAFFNYNDHCFEELEGLEGCKAAAANYKMDTSDINAPFYVKCAKNGPPYCFEPASAADHYTGKDVTGAVVNPFKKLVIDAVTFVLEKIANIVLAVVYMICWLLLHLAGLFVDLSAVFLHATLDSALYNDMFKSDVVSKGWIIVRDVCNMFFILILLVISLATILRIQTYKAQSLLLPLLIAAFLVNFSRPIVELAIDASQILMYQFVNLMGGSFIDSKVNITLSGITDIFINSFSGWDKVGTIIKGDLINAASWVIAIMFALVFLLVLAAVYVAMAMFMIIRLVALTILIIFSPIGFFFNILPQTKSYASKYWAELSKYLIFGPVMAFFIYLAGSLAITVPVDLENRLKEIATGNEVLTVTVAANKVLTEGGTVLVSLLGELLPYVVIMVFLYASIWIARQLGIAGADKVEGMTTGKLAAGGAAVGGFLGGAVGGYMSRSLAKGKLPWQDTVRSVVRRVPGGKGLDKLVQGAAKKKMTTKSGKEISVGRIKEQALGLFSPGAVKRGYQGHIEAEEAEAYGVSSGRMQDLMERTYVMGWKKPTHEELARQSRVADIQNKTKTENPAILTNLLNTAIEEQDDERVEALSGKLAAGGDTSDIMELRGFENSPEGYDKYIRSLGKWMGENKAGRISSNVAELEKRKGNSSYHGQSAQDAKTEKFHYAEKNDFLKEANKKFKGLTSIEMKNVDAKTFIKTIKVEKKDKNGNIERDKDGNPKMEDQYHLGDIGMMNLRSLTPDHVTWGLRGKPKDLEKLHEAFEREEAKVGDLETKIGMFGFEFKDGIKSILKGTAKTKMVNKGKETDTEIKKRRSTEEEIEIEEEKKV